MSYLLDTNIISEVLRNKPNQQVINWLTTIPPENLYISVLTMGEIRKGVEKLPASKRKNDIMMWLENELPKWFSMNNILPITQEVANKWGYITAHSKNILPVIDGLLAATALTYNLKMVTRNVKDFRTINLEIVDPFI